MPSNPYTMYKVDANDNLIEDDRGMSVWTEDAKKFYSVVLVPVMASIYKEAKKAKFSGYDFEDMIAECMAKMEYNK